MVWRRLVCAVTLAAPVLSARTPLVAPTAHSSSTLSTPSGDRSVSALDPEFARAVGTEQPARHILRLIAVDLDRDGDLDVIAATVEEPVVVWLRDNGGFTRQRPRPSSRMTAAHRIDEPAAGGDVPGELTSSQSRTAADAASRYVSADASGRLVRVTEAPRSSAIARASHSNRGPPAGRLA